MDGFKDSTRTQYMKGGSVSCYAKGGKAEAKGAAKISKVMGEFKRGELHSGAKTGPKVTSRKQAIAIAMSEADKKPMKKAMGGPVAGDPRAARLMQAIQARKAQGVPVMNQRPLVGALSSIRGRTA